MKRKRQPFVTTSKKRKIKDDLKISKFTKNQNNLTKKRQRMKYVRDCVKNKHHKIKPTVNIHKLSKKSVSRRAQIDNQIKVLTRSLAKSNGRDVTITHNQATTILGGLQNSKNLITQLNSDLSETVLKNVQLSRDNARSVQNMIEIYNYYFINKKIGEFSLPIHEDGVNMMVQKMKENKS